MNRQRVRQRAIVMAMMCVVMMRGSAGPTVLMAQSSQMPGGSSAFQTYCSSCHGTSAKGDGPIAALLTPRPADLTRIAQRAGGEFPSERVARTIDGRSPAKGHGGSDMPVWGDAFAKSRADGLSVDEKIRQLVQYLATIQVK